MNLKLIEAHELIAKARESLRRGDKASARQVGERAALLAPDLEDVWLVLAASDPNPEDALAYARKALQLNPQSGRAHRAVEWASGRLNQGATVPNAVPVEPAAPAHRQQAYQTAVAMPVLKNQGRNWLLPALLIGAGVLFIGFLALVAIAGPTVASLVKISGPMAPAPEKLWAPMEIAKPVVTPIDVSAFAPQAENTSVPTAAPTIQPTDTEAATAEPTEESTQEPTQAPTDVPTESSTVIPDFTETPGSMVMEVLEETPTSEYTAPKPESAVGNGSRWIDVDLTNQMVYAYEGDVVVNSFLVSTGTWMTPTVTGEYKIYVKYRSASMSGPGYFLPDVPYVMYFYKGYGLHGTYWHSNFGTPMSHGCVNLRTDEAGWLFGWASVGTVVNVHY